MKNHQSTRRLTQLLSLLSLTLLGLTSLHAAECPESSPEDPQMRRKLAKEWFSNAETAENSNDNAEAVRAYACSYKMVAHPFTAYNLARVAERAENFELSLKMYKAYLALKPDAPDKAEVSDKVRILEDKIKEAAAAPPEPAEPPPPAIIENPPEHNPVTPPPIHVTTPPADDGVEEGARSGGSHAVAWIVGGVSVAALVGGIALNLSARSKMSSCNTNAKNNYLATANDQCNAAVPLAYMSYAMFGVATVGAAVDAIILWRSASDGKGDDTQVSLQYLPGGAGVLARGRF